MIYVSEIQTYAPQIFKTNLQEKVYRTLEDLQIPFERVDTDEVITMEDCIAVNEKLNMKMVKNAFSVQPSADRILSVHYLRGQAVSFKRFQ